MENLSLPAKKKKKALKKTDLPIFAISVVALVMVVFHRYTQENLELKSGQPSDSRLSLQSANGPATNLYSINTNLKLITGKVNDSRMETDIQNELSRPAESLNEKDLLPLDQENSVPVYSHLELDSQNPAQEIADSLKQPRSGSASRNPLEEQVDLAIEKAEFLNKYNEQYRKQYVREVIENAKQKGYRVRFNKDYTIHSIEKLSRYPSNQ